MKKITLLALTASLILSAAYAYNPPVGSEDMCLLAGPKTLSGAATVAGGPLFNAGPETILVNPALPAKEQRVTLNAAYTFFYSSDDTNESQIGNAFQGGILIPCSLFVFSGYADGLFIPFQEMQLGNSLNGKVGLAKEITDKLSVGASVSGGYAWSGGKDWSLAGNLGFYVRQGDLGFMKDFRYGMSVLNLGKNYNPVLRSGVKADEEITAFPTILTVKLGAAASIIKTDILDWGMALDFTTPFFQNLIVDFSTQISIKDMLVVSVNEKVNMVEMINDHKNMIPSIGIIFKFAFDVKNNNYLESNGWSQSEMTLSTAYKNMYSSVNAISAGVDVNLGMKDTQAPEINIW